jgi:enamine deaminase RidA (YjgF/YER057c/UK114 family)
MTQDRRRISSGSPYEKSIGFSRALAVGNRIIVSGTAPIGDDGRTAGESDAYAQTIRCLEIIRKAVEQAGGSLEHIVRTRIYITDRSNWEAIGRAHGEFFSEIRPAATMIVVSGLIDPDWLVEIEAEGTL